MKFTLEIQCDNAAFQPAADDAETAETFAAAAREVRRILREAGTDRMGGPGIDTFGGRQRSGFLRDTNGNRCGQWSLHEEEPETLDAMLARHARELAAIGEAAAKPDAELPDEAKGAAAVLELSKAEAQALAEVLGRVGGTPETTARGYTGRTAMQLLVHGFALDLRTQGLVQGQLYFTKASRAAVEA